MDYKALVGFVQGHFTDGLVLVIGSGLSAAEGIPGMPALATHLVSHAGSLTGADAKRWSQIKTVIDAGEGLEAALLKHAPTAALETWIAQRTAELLMPREREVMGAVVRGERTLRLTTFLNEILKPPTGLPILTPNYDRLIEVACEMAGFHVDTTAVGHYAGAFDHKQSCMGSCRGILNRGRTPFLDYFPRAIVLKPHGSFDFTAKDPIDFAGGDTNLYAYVSNDPVNLADRLGLFPDRNPVFPLYDPGVSGPGDPPPEPNKCEDGFGIATGYSANVGLEGTSTTGGIEEPTINLGNVGGFSGDLYIGWLPSSSDEYGEMTLGLGRYLGLGFFFGRPDAHGDFQVGGIVIHVGLGFGLPLSITGTGPY